MDYNTFMSRQEKVTLSGLSYWPIEIAYTDIGNGPPVVLMHGIPTWSFLYLEVIDRLAANHRVIAPDFIGHGSSDKRDGLDRSLLAQRNMILALLDALGIGQATLIGHDTGGGVALIMAVENPSRVNSLVLSNIVAYDSWPIDDMINIGHPNWAKKTTAEVRAFLQSGFEAGFSRKDRLTQEFIDGIIAPYLTNDGKISLVRNASSLNTNHTTMLVGRHQTIKAETLIVWGVDDPWQPVTDGERLALEIPRARLIRVANASHWIPQDAPQDWLEAVLPFLTRDTHRAD
jgi:Predicted hydrolases or acyltransferases (alpha/beta hydrolase superfamily)